MNDVEIESLLTSAGYQYDALSGRYIIVDGISDEDQDLATEDISDQLEIPVEDLLRWELIQTAADRD